MNKKLGVGGGEMLCNGAPFDSGHFSKSLKFPAGDSVQVRWRAACCWTP